jgi:hypothetical protein
VALDELRVQTGVRIEQHLLKVLEVISDLRKVYGLFLTAADSHHLTEPPRDPES